MTRKTSVLFLVGICAQAVAQDSPVVWNTELAAGKAAFGAGKYAIAVEKYREALKKAEDAGATNNAILPILRSLAAALRTNADPAGAQPIVERTLAIVEKTFGESSLESAPILSELARLQRAQDLRKEAVASLVKAIAFRSSTAVSEELAKDTTLVANILREMGEDESAMQYFETALALWGALPDSGLQILTALDPFAGMARDKLSYERADELYTWALRLREAALGPKDTELIATIDSLAYVMFGQKKYAEAENLYNRLLGLWEAAGGPEHPMVALTLDKMGEFYIAQKRYEEAEPIVQRAAGIRSKAAVESLHRAGRVLTGLRKFGEASNVYERSIRIAEDAQIPDDKIPGTLRAYALLLRQTKRDKEADRIEKRVKEERRPAPVPVPAP